MQKRISRTAIILLILLIPTTISTAYPHSFTSMADYNFFWRQQYFHGALAISVDNKTAIRLNNGERIRLKDGNTNDT